MKYKLHITYDDYKAARKLAMRTRPFTFLLLCIYLVLLGFLCASSVMAFVRTGEELGLIPLCAGGVFIFLLFMFLFLALLMPMRWRRVYRQQKLFQTAFECEFGEDAFRSSSEHGTAAVPWEKFHKWREGKKTFLIYQSDAICHCIPKRIFTSQEEEDRLRQILVRALGKASR